MSLPAFGRAALRGALATAALAAGLCAVPPAQATEQTQPDSAVRINTGGAALTDTLGRPWVADGWVGGGRREVVGSTLYSATPDVDRTGRRGSVRYAIPVQVSGTYDLVLHVTDAQPLAGAPGFAVLVEGRALEVPAATQAGARLVPLQVQVTDGRLDLWFRSLPGGSVLAGVEVLPREQESARTAVPVEAYGAVGDGRTDDTAALQRALDAAGPGTTLVLGAGRTYAHGDVLRVRRPGTRLTGPGRLLATDEARSSVWVEADDVVLDGGLTLSTAATTRRWEAWEQMGLRVAGGTGLVVRDVTVEGSAAAGVYVGGAANFLLERVTVRGSRADGIHLTAGARDGRVVSPTVVDSGDDGVAVVSYASDGAPCSNITIESPRVLGTTWGRGVSVVGGTDITYTDVQVERSSAAAVYLASEGAPWFTTAPVRVRVLGGTLTGANQDPRVDHGALVVLAGGAQAPQDVLVRGLTITDTRSSASRSVGVITYATPPTGVVLQDIAVRGGPRSAYSGNSPDSSYSLLNWTVDGVPVPDHLP